MENYDFEKYLEIDRDSLDKEWLNQASIYMKWAKLSAKADEIYLEKKEKLELIYAKIDQEVRENTEIKLTETLVKNMVISDRRYIEFSEEVRKSGYEKSVLDKALKAMEQRKTALENLVKLWIGSYYSEPKNQKTENEEGFKEKIMQDKMKELKENIRR